MSLISKNQGGMQACMIAIFHSSSNCSISPQGKATSGNWLNNIFLMNTVILKIANYFDISGSLKFNK